MEDKASRDARKLEAKALKRKRIEEGGGKRPRPPASQQQEPKLSKKKQKQKKKTKSKNGSGGEAGHRFGRVMEHTPCPNEARMSTLSIAIPGSIVSNAQTQELRMHLVGQIARAAAIYHIDEIVVFNDRLGKNIRPNFCNNFRRRDRDGDNNYNHGDNHRDRDRDGDNNQNKKKEEDFKTEHDQQSEKRMQPSTDPHAFMARILQYCECPQYLRRHFFPMHPDLQFAGLLAPLDAPHHVRVLDRSEFREGVVMEKEATDTGSFVNCGIRNQPVE